MAHGGLPGKAYFAGIALPPCPQTRETLAEQGHEFTSAQSAALDLRGLPVALNHKNEVMTVGTVLDSWQTGDGSKMVLGELDDSEGGIYTQHGIGDGIYKGLSLQHNFTIFEDQATGKTYTQHKPVELSVCKEGRRPGTDIIMMVPAAKMATGKRSSSATYNMGPRGNQAVCVTRGVSKAMAENSLGAAGGQAASAAATPASSQGAPASQQGGGGGGGSGAKSQSLVPTEVDFTTARAADLAHHLVGQRVELTNATHENAALKKELEALRSKAEAFDTREREEKEEMRKKYNALQKTLLGQLKKQFSDGFITPEVEETLDAGAKFMPDAAIKTMNTLLQVASCASEGWEKANADASKKLQEYEQRTKEWELRTLSQKFNSLSAPMPVTADPGRLADPASRFEAPAPKARDPTEGMRVPTLRTMPPPEAAAPAITVAEPRKAFSYDDQIRASMQHPSAYRGGGSSRPLAYGLSEAGAGRTGGGAMVMLGQPRGSPAPACFQDVAPDTYQAMSKSHAGMSLASIQTKLSEALRGGGRTRA